MHPRYDVIQKKSIDEIAKDLDIKTVAKLPIKPEVAAMVDNGRAEDIDVSALNDIFEAIKEA